MDREVIQKLAEKYEDVKELFERHQELDKELQKLAKRPYLSPEEEKREKEMKVEKLKIKEKIVELIKKYEGISLG